MSKYQDPFNVKSILQTKQGDIHYFSLVKLAQQSGFSNIAGLPYSIKVLLEAILRQIDNFTVTEDDLKNISSWSGQNVKAQEIPFKPARVVMQDFTGVPGIVDLAAMRDALQELGKDPQKINPQLPVDLVIDHSIQLDRVADKHALQYNIEKEFERNQERYEFLKWGSKSFQNFRVIPPATGIIHQVNLEFLATVVQTSIDENNNIFAYPDSLVGTDSHTTMINGLGVLGWGVGGIEAEAVMLGQPVYMLMPEVVGFKLDGKLSEGITATDLVLSIVEKLRQVGVVGKFVEFYGPGISHLSLADRATIANMAPEYGATMGFFPVDSETLKYLHLTGRSKEQIDLVEKYTKEQDLFYTDSCSDPQFSQTVELDISSVKPSISGPKRPQDRILLSDSKKQFFQDATQSLGISANYINTSEFNDSVRSSIIQNKDYTKTPSQEKLALFSKSSVPVKTEHASGTFSHGSIAIASITSCTNTSNPSVIFAAGLLAQKAVKKGLLVSPLVKTSLAPGSKVVTQYLKKANLIEPLEKLGFHIVGYGCTTCIGNSGPIDPNLLKAIQENSIVATAVLSGNRNFEGRIHSDVKANYLASPPLVVAYALVGTIDFDFDVEPISFDTDNNPVYLKDIWPTNQELKAVLETTLTRKMFEEEYDQVTEKNKLWNSIQVTGGDLYKWQDSSTYIRRPGFFEGISLTPPDIQDIINAKTLVYLGDSVTTDHISPAGSISKDSPAAIWLNEHNVTQENFNSFGSRRGNHEIMMRGTFGNLRIHNKLTPHIEGGYTKYLPDNTEMAIYDASMKYQSTNTNLIVIAGKEYGTGSSRDWAAKGTYLLGVKAVIAESYERIHRSNLIGMGVLPLEFLPNENAEKLELTGTETFNIKGLHNNIQPKEKVTVEVVPENNEVFTFSTIVRLDTPVEVQYYHNEGILQTVLRTLSK